MEMALHQFVSVLSTKYLALMMAPFKAIFTPNAAYLNNLKIFFIVRQCPVFKLTSWFFFYFFNSEQ